jgi:hypothetical protein
MKKIIISAAMLFSTFMYSQEMPFRLMESMCKAEVWNSDSSRFEPHELYKDCYGLYFGRQNDTMIIAIASFKDSTDWTYYKVLSYQNMIKWELHWLYRAIQMDTGMPCTIHHFRQQYYDDFDPFHTYNMVRVDLENYTIRYTDEQQGQ